MKPERVEFWGLMKPKTIGIFILLISMLQNIYRFRMMLVLHITDLTQLILII